MELFFLRHGIAEDPHPGLTDADRALTPEGVQQLKVIARAMSRLDFQTTLIMTSPLRRCQETAALVAPTVGGTLRVEPALAPGCTWELLQGVLRGIAGEAILLVGHAPDMGSLIGAAIGSPGGRGIKVAKAGLGCVEFPGRPRAGSGTLRYLLRPRQLVMIGGST